jgi:hypothetical protein
VVTLAAMPNSTAIVGAPHAASSGRPMSIANRARQLRYGAAAQAQSTNAVANNCANSGVVSWPSWSKPSEAISASNAPSAMARA